MAINFAAIWMSSCGVKDMVTLPGLAFSAIMRETFSTQYPIPTLSIAHYPTSLSYFICSIPFHLHNIPFVAPHFTLLFLSVVFTYITHCVVTYSYDVSWNIVT